MTKSELKYIIKHYQQITKTIKLGLTFVTLKGGKRKKIITVTEHVKKVCEIIEMVYDSEDDEMIKKMIRSILDGERDLFILQNIVFYEKNAYYSRKLAFRDKVYNCCIASGLVSIEEVLKEKIA